MIAPPRGVAWVTQTLSHILIPSKDTRTETCLCYHSLCPLARGTRPKADVVCDSYEVAPLKRGMYYTPEDWSKQRVSTCHGLISTPDTGVYATTQTTCTTSIDLICDYIRIAVLVPRWKLSYGRGHSKDTYHLFTKLIKWSGTSNKHVY